MMVLIGERVGECGDGGQFDSLFKKKKKKNPKIRLQKGPLIGHSHRVLRCVARARNCSARCQAPFLYHTLAVLSLLLDFPPHSPRKARLTLAITAICEWHQVTHNTDSDEEVNSVLHMTATG